MFYSKPCSLGKSFVLVITVLAMGAWLFSFSNIALAGAADYGNQADCTDHNYYWYDGTETCYETENGKLSAQVSHLMDKIDQLTTTIAELSGEKEEEDGASEWCHTFHKSLSLRAGNQGDPVRYLQTALGKEGYNISDSEKTRDYFGRTTASAVTEFQEKYAEEILAPWNLRHGTGYVGKTTRKKLNELYGCGEQEKSITVTSPNGGEVWKVGETYEIEWNSSSEIKGVYLALYRDGKYVETSLRKESPWTIKGGSYKWTVPEHLAEGDYKMKVMGNTEEATGVVEDFSNGTFEIVKEEQEKSITVTSPNGGEEWEIGNEYTVKWESEGIEKVNILLMNYGAPENCYLNTEIDCTGDTVPQSCEPVPVSAETGSYSFKLDEIRCFPGMNTHPLMDVETGDEYKIIVGNAGSGNEQDESSNYFSIVEKDCHTSDPWSWNYCSADCPCEAGMGDCDKDEDCTTGYCAQGVGDEYGQSSSIDVCREKSITLVNPTGGETLKEGNDYKITWNSSNLPDEAEINLSLWRQGEQGQQSIQIASDLPVDTTEYNWEVNTEGTWAYPCFAEGTKVLMKDKNYKSIEDIKKGEHVLSYDLQEEKFKTSEVSEVVHRKDPLVVINEELKAVPDQKIYVNGGFEKAKKIEAGDTLLNKDGEEVKVHSVDQRTEEKVDTYDLVLKGSQNFFAENYLVHSAPSSEELRQVYSVLTSEQATATSYRLRIFASWGDYGSDNYGEVKDVSDYFTIESEEQEKSITVTSPNGGEQWQTKIGETHRVTWDSTGGINKVKVSRCMTEEFYDQNNVASHISIPRCSTETIDNDESHTYEGGKGRDDLIESVISRLEGIEATKNIVKVEDASDSSIGDSSDDYFTITSGDCHTSNPWSWNYCSADCPCDAGMGDCDSDEDCTTGYCAQDVGDEYGQSSSIDVCEEESKPDLTVESIKFVPSQRNYSSSDSLDVEVVIKNKGEERAGSFQLNYSNKNSNGQSIDIGSTGFSELKAGEEYTDKLGYGSFYWATEGENEFQVNIDSEDQVEESNEGNNRLKRKFTLGQKKSITVTSPNGREEWKKGTTHDITWNSQNIEEVTIRLISREPETSPITEEASRIASNVNASEGSYSWVIPKEGIDTESYNYKVKIIGQGEGVGVEDSSDDYFTINYERKKSPCGSYGDVNSDGYVTVEDGDLINQTLDDNNWKTWSRAKRSRADVNNTGEVEQQDAELIDRYYSGLDSNFPVCEERREPPCQNYGDIYEDGYVTSIDMMLAARIVSGLESGTQEQEERIDIDGSGELEYDDYIKIGKYAQQEIDTFPICFTGCPSSVSYQGQTYSTVQIGSQCWMAENLNVGTKITANYDYGGAHQENNGTIEKYCYDDSNSKCDTYGSLYQWDEAMQYTTSEGAQGICPDGWHIPTDSEWSTLESNVCGDEGDEGSALAGKADLWGGSYEIEEDDDFECSGFDTLPGGTCGEVTCYNGNWGAYLWSSTEADSSETWYRRLSRGLTNVERYAGSKEGGYSVRCLKGESSVSGSGNIEEQLASLSSAVSELVKKIEEMLGD